MKYADADDELTKMDEEWCTTIRYHQLFDRQYRHWDRAVKISVSFLAVVGLVVSPGPAYYVGVISLFLSMALNILPFSDWQYHHHLLSKQWIELRSKLLSLHLSIKNENQKSALKDLHLKKIKDLRKKDQILSASEPPPNLKILRRCQGDEIESRWGSGVRTPEQVDDLVRKRKGTADANIASQSSISAKASNTPSGSST